MDSKEELARKKFGKIFEAIQKETKIKRDKLSEKMSRDGLKSSGPHAKAIIDLELENVEKMLTLELKNRLEVFYKKNPPCTKKDKDYLVARIKHLYEGRMRGSQQALLDSFNRFGFRNQNMLFEEFHRNAQVIYSNLKRDIEIMILENQFLSPRLQEVDTDNLIKGGESDHVEFKATFQWDVKKDKHNKDLRYLVIKTLAAFNNTDGGDLLIGVNDNRSIYGLEKDYSLLSKKNQDGFLLALTQEIENKISKEFASAVKIDIQTKQGKDICWIRVKFGEDGVWVRKNKTEELFYIRSQNKSITLPPKEAANYIRKRWP